MAYREEESGLNVVAVENGVNASPAGVVKLGGSLTEPTVLTASPANTLAVAGLQPGAVTDSFVTVDAAGVVRRSPAATMVTNALTFAAGAFTSNVAGVAATLTPTAGTPVTQLGVNAAGALVASPVADFWSSNAALGTITNPDGSTDLTDAIHRGNAAGTARVGVNVAPLSASLQVAATTATGVAAMLDHYTPDSLGSRLVMRKSRGSTVGAAGAVQFNDIIASVEMFAHNGTGFQPVANIRTVAADNHSPTAAGTSMIFSTTRLGTVGMIDAMQIVPLQEPGLQTTGTPYLHMTNVSQDRRITFWDAPGAAGDFYGFGLRNPGPPRAGEMRYQVPFAANHRFYAGTNPAIADFSATGARFYGAVGTGTALTGPAHFFGGHDGTAVTQGAFGTAFVRIDPGGRDGVYLAVSRQAATGFSVANTGGTWTVVGAVPYTVVSDGRFKSGVQRLSSALERTLRLSGVEFDWTGDSPNTGHDLGFIAQDVQQVVPEAVHDIGDGHLGVQHTKIVPLLVEAVRELAAEMRRLGGNVPDITPTY